MKKCPICGCFNKEAAPRCSICGVNFPKDESVKSLAPPLSMQSQSEAQGCRLSQSTRTQDEAQGETQGSHLAPSMQSQGETQGCRPSPVIGFREESNKTDRMAIAGFVLSLMGLVAVVSSPLQLAALLLSLAANGTKRFREFRTLGIVFSAVGLGVSLLFWLIFSLFGGTIVSFITDALNNYN
jgi:hypothetical protein